MTTDTKPTFKPYREIVGSKLKLNLHTGQTKAWDSTSRFTVIMGGTQVGKTCFAPDWMEREIKRRGPGDYLAITATFPLLSLKLLPEFRFVFEDIYHYGTYNTSTKTFTFHRVKKKETDVVLFTDKQYEEAGVRECRIIFGSATNPESIESATAKAAVLDECVSPETLISTEYGVLPIGEIVEKKLRLRVWSYDTESEIWELKPIVRWIKLPQNKPLLKFGNLKLTGNHKVWTSKKYVRADELIASMGDEGGESSEDGFVYNLEVEGNHNYIANGILVSNCGQKQFRRDAWEATLRRLSLAQGRALLITTLYGYGWLKTEVYDEWEKGNPDFDIIQIDSIVNPSFPVEEYQRAKLTMPDWKFQLFYRGRYSKPVGMIYDSFDSVNAVIDPFEIPEKWPVYVGHDFGSNNTAALWFANDPDTGYFYLFQEYLAGGRATHEHVNEWIDMSQGYRIIRRVGGANHEDGWRGDFSQAGWRIDKPTVREVDAGILKVYGFHATNKLFVFRNCVNYLDEKQSYSYVLDEERNFIPTEKIENKERYHLLDAERYVLSDFNPVDNMLGKPQSKRSSFRF